ncbi:MAG: Mov34/MPN/PAD-1 family protein [Candidatus Lokiarchaeota archaeon]|nr:Mov34/MPN/PAD-1 family protein [Candidatus Lokiarchaeota archaeon]
MEDIKGFLIEQYQKLDTIEGEPAEALLKRAEIIISIKRPGVAVELCEYMRDNYPEVAQLATYLAATQYEKLKNFEHALNMYKEAYTLEPENSLFIKSYQDLARTLLLEFKGRFKTAINAFDTLEPKDMEIIRKYPSYSELERKVDELYTPPRLKELIAQKKTRIKEQIFNVSQQIKKASNMFTIEKLDNYENRYSVDLGENYAVFMDLSDYPDPPKFEFPVFIVEKLSTQSLSDRLYSLRTWLKSEPYSLTEVLRELKACLGFYGFGKIQISQQFLNLAKQTAKEHAPNEMGGFVQLDRWVIWRLRLPARYFSTPFATGYYKDQIPFMDTSIVGFIHSHTLGPPIPSDQDRQTFNMYYINMILGSTKGESSLDLLRVFDREGNEREWELTQILEEDTFPIEDTDPPDPKENIYV